MCTNTSDPHIQDFLWGLRCLALNPKPFGIPTFLCVASLIMKDAHNDLSKVMRAPDIPSLGLRIEGLAFWYKMATDGMIA